MATAMKYRGFAGAVIDASVRDTPQIRKLQFPVFSRGVVPSTTINHYRVTGVNVPVDLRRRTVNPGDIVTADEDGVAVVPKATSRGRPEEVAGARRHRAPDAPLHREVPVDQGSGQAVRKDLTSMVTVGVLVLTSGLLAQAGEPGRKTFETFCSRCHGADGNGGEMGPPIASRLAARTDAQLAKFIHDGSPTRGMPPMPVPDSEMPALLTFLRDLQHQAEEEAAVVQRLQVRTVGGATLDGEVVGKGFDDLQLRTDDHRVHLLRRASEGYREVTSAADWPTYNGDPRGNRYTTLTQIDKSTVARLGVAWMFTLEGTGQLQVTPVVAGGIMYVAGPNECYALDAGSGREIWHYKRPKTAGLSTGGHANRGVAVAGDRVFMETDNAHVIALNRFTGELLWDTELDDWHKNYSASSAPLPAGNLVVSGVAGGEHGANGFVVAHDQETGKEVWRFWTVPKRGEPGSETWQGKDIDHGGAPTWFTGSYDPELDLVYWPTGNPSKEYNGDHRQGDNLYSDCILALDRKTGRLKWHYQFTPHDLWDWDATETSVLVDAPVAGATEAPDAARQPQRLLLRLRSARRHAAARQAIRDQPDVGERNRIRRPAHQAAEPGTHAGGHESVPVAGRCNELVLSVVQP